MDTNQKTYQSLDKLTRWYLLSEFGYAVLFLALGLVMLFMSLVSRGMFDFWYYTEAIIIFGIAIPYGLAYIGNLVIGVWSLFLNIQTKHEGYPGTGLLLNWFFICATFWVFLILLVALVGGI